MHDYLDTLNFHFGLMNDDGRRIFGKPEIVTVATSTYPIVRHPAANIDLVAIPASAMLNKIRAKGKIPFAVHREGEDMLVSCED